MAQTRLTAGPTPRAFYRRAILTVAIGLLVAPLVERSSAQQSLERRLYVANDAERRIDVFDIDNHHALDHSFTPQRDGVKLLDSRCRGIAAHAGTARIYFTDSDLKHVVALDLLTEKVVWVRRFDEAECKHPDRLSVTVDGRALYVPCKLSDNLLVLDDQDGRTLRTHTVGAGEAPHNTYTGERGKYKILQPFRGDVGGQLFLAEG